MGYDRFCPICGNTNVYNKFDKYTDENMNDFFDRFQNLIKDEKHKKNIISELKSYTKDFKWLNQVTVLTPWNTNKKFIDYNDPDYTASMENNYNLESLTNFDYGLWVHTDCVNFIKKIYKIDLKFSDLPFILSSKGYNINTIENIDYGPMLKYNWQYIDYAQMYFDKNIFISFSPLKNSKNALRIKKICNQIKFKKNRAGPSVSATFYKNNDIKFGNNNKFWIKKNNKWVQLNDEVEKKTLIYNNKNVENYYDKLIKIPFIGYFNTIPLFINNYKQDKKNHIFEIYGTSNTINNIKPLIPSNS
jgi:hypothetical protein